MENNELLNKLYYSLIDEAAKKQARLIELETLVDYFGSQAIVPQSMAWTRRTLSDSVVSFPRYIEQHKKQLTRLYVIIEQMEEVFAKNEALDIKAFAEAMADRLADKFREDKKGSNRAT